ncbi:peptide ABC transporter ATP-binding protein [Siminovitchia terrae]|uniref:Peptide ABC transporter ATP-binding protein n=1 Tax=Siminovitchia terrae TaxID=1914933 RepID=A0ABQ4KRX0_SIMTE|nr:ABC transporter ATP-binding protein [Siminovitchia terrae]GIN94783.1 peptide ABC transporter ATP-binding protein [Siminovitchia terrae]
MREQKLLEVKNLSIYFNTEKGQLTAVDQLSFSVQRGETVGLVGESGCGKSVTSESILRLHDERKTGYEGEILFKGKDLLKVPTKEMLNIRGNEVSMIFQDPMSSLNPVLTIGHQIAESIRKHQKLSKEKAYEKVIDLLRLTGIPSPEKRAHEYPHKLSGGMRQRVMIALALACEPELLIADEPTTALDVTTQAQILELIQDLKERYNMGTLLITHDLSVVAEVCSRVIVMYLGQIIEEADVPSLFSNPLHPYTRGLLKSIPKMDGDRSQKLHVIPGKVPSLQQIPNGCRFADRCEYATEICRIKDPEMTEVSTTHRVKCWNFENIPHEGVEQYA